VNVSGADFTLRWENGNSGISSVENSRKVFLTDMRAEPSKGKALKKTASIPSSESLPTELPVDALVLRENGVSALCINTVSVAVFGSIIAGAMAST